MAWADRILAPYEGQMAISEFGTPTVRARRSMAWSVRLLTGLVLG
jgi:hypothetical protein